VRVKPNQDLTELRLDLRQETQYFSLEKAQEIADTSGLFKKEATPDEQVFNTFLKRVKARLNLVTESRNNFSYAKLTIHIILMRCAF
ncbi:hypothetical protein QYM36_012311, partial [Artemia franciscana]